MALYVDARGLRQHEPTTLVTVFMLRLLLEWKQEDMSLVEIFQLFFPQNFFVMLDLKLFVASMLIMPYCQIFVLFRHDLIEGLAREPS